MTMDIHLQITLPDCVTPNVPRIKASFFNRKFRDIQSSPTTPKVSSTRVKVTTRNRSKRSGGSTGNGSANRQKTFSPYNGRPSRSRPSNSELFDPDFSTPRATKALLTPSLSSTKITKNGRVAHLIYKPLELDNESSSESIDSRRKRHKIQSLEVRSPLAIEDSNMTVKYELQDCNESTTNILAIENSKPSIQEKKASQGSLNTPNNSRDEVEVESDNEPEIIEVKSDKIVCQPDFPSFTPGNCDINAVLKMFGKKELKKKDQLSQGEKEPELTKA